ncbi:MAG TPA: porin [Puia sp.]|nr:porin [Puia sp.]
MKIILRNGSWQFIFSPPIIFLMIGAALLLSFNCYSQEKKDIIPDGTQGELFEAPTKDSTKMTWNQKRWRLFNGRFTSFKFGAGFLYEYAAFFPDKNSKLQMDSLGTPLKDQFKVRDFRLLFSGQFKSKREISWRTGIMYDASSDSWLFRETGIMVGVPEISSYFFVGRTKEGFSMSKVMNGYAGWAFERQMAIDVIPILADGLKWMGYLPKQKLFWNLGVYTDWLSKGQSFSTYQSQFDIRVGWNPISHVTINKMLHVGINYRYGKVADDQIQLRSRPEANPAPYFITTGKFSATHSNHIGYEIYYQSGRWLTGSEYYWHKFSSVPENDPLFSGGELMVSYIITGESRKYMNSTSIFGFVPVKNSVFKGGLGEIDVLLRFTTLDLNGGQIQGGKFWRLTPMMNWYLSPELRFELGYGYGVLDRFGVKGVTQFFQSRIQLTIL